MGDRRHIIYADEPDRKGAYCSNFFGGVLLSAEDGERTSRSLDDMKEHLGFHRELKWQNIGAENADRYIAFIRPYFSMIADGTFRVRIMFTQNSNVPVGLTAPQGRNPYFLLYYQFFKHAFGIAYSNMEAEGRVFFSIFPDKLPDTDENAATFKNTYTASSEPGACATRASICREPTRRMWIRAGTRSFRASTSFWAQ